MSEPGHTAEEVAAYHDAGFWARESLVDYVRRWSDEKPDQTAFAADETSLSWAEYERRSTGLAGVLIHRGLQPGDRMAALLPDGPETHVAWLAMEKAGLVAVGIGARG